MTPEDYIKLVESRLRDEQVELTTEVIGGVTALIGYRPRFRLAWMATRLHLFTVVSPAQSISGPEMAQFTREALTYAVGRKGRLRGFQTGVAAIAVLVGDHVEPDAATYAQSDILKRWSAFGWPAAVDLTGGRVFRHEGRVVIGGVYANWMRSQCALATPEPQSTV